MNKEQLIAAAASGTIVFAMSTVVGALTMNGIGSMTLPEVILVQNAGTGIAVITLILLLLAGDET